MSTLKNVAARCGVDISTASRALRSDPRVKESTRLRVVQAAEELQYSPNLSARNLVEGRSRTLALITTSLSNPLEHMPAQYASSYLQNRSYDLMISLSGGVDKTYERLLSRLEQNIFDGAIIIPGCPINGESERILHRLEKKHFPLVFLDRWDNRLSFPVVTTDNQLAGEVLADKLLTRGCTEIIILKELENGVEEDRIAGEIKACKKRGVIPQVISNNEMNTFRKPQGIVGIISTSCSLLHHFLNDSGALLDNSPRFFGVFDKWAGSPYPAKEVIICKQDFKAMAHQACEHILNRLEQGSHMASPCFIKPLEYVTLRR